MKLVFALLLVTLITSSGLAATELTLSKWETLSDMDKEALINQEDLETYSNLKFIEVESIDQAKASSTSSVVDFIQLMDTNLRADVSFDIEDEHSTVGDTEISAVSVLVVGNDILGGAISYFQKGCDLEEENYQSYATEDEARAAGCDVDADVSWQTHGIFDRSGKILSSTGYMEWSGY